jgi:hypothetical protein
LVDNRSIRKLISIFFSVKFLKKEPKKKLKTFTEFLEKYTPRKEREKHLKENVLNSRSGKCNAFWKATRRSATLHYLVQ